MTQNKTENPEEMELKTKKRSKKLTKEEKLKMEIEEITKATGKDYVHKLNYEDLITTDINISTSTGIEHT